MGFRSDGPRSHIDAHGGWGCQCGVCLCRGRLWRRHFDLPPVCSPLVRQSRANGGPAVLTSPVRASWCTRTDRDIPLRRITLNVLTAKHLHHTLIRPVTHLHVHYIRAVLVGNFHARIAHRRQLYVLSRLIKSVVVVSDVIIAIKSIVNLQYRSRYTSHQQRCRSNCFGKEMLVMYQHLFTREVTFSSHNCVCVYFSAILHKKTRNQKHRPPGDNAYRQDILSLHREWSELLSQ